MKIIKKHIHSTPIYGEDSNYILHKICFQIDRISAIHAWLRNNLTNELYYHKDYMGKQVSAYDQKFIGNTIAMRLGPPRLRQLRVKNGWYFYSSTICQTMPAQSIAFYKLLKIYIGVPYFKRMVMMSQ